MSPGAFRNQLLKQKIPSMYPPPPPQLPKNMYMYIYMYLTAGFGSQR